MMHMLVFAKTLISLRKMKWSPLTHSDRFPSNPIESFFEIYKEHSHRTESRNARFTHGVFVTNNQISKYLEAFSKKGLY